MRRSSGGTSAIGSDVGTKDGLIRDDTLIHEELDRFGVANRWETYEGTHTDHIGQRFDEVVLPFFGEHLEAATMGSGERG